jgi:hypothetical protein
MSLYHQIGPKPTPGFGQITAFIAGTMLMDGALADVDGPLIPASVNNRHTLRVQQAVYTRSSSSIFAHRTLNVSVLTTFSMADAPEWSGWNSLAMNRFN